MQESIAAPARRIAAAAPESAEAAVSWGAIIAGAVASMTVALILMVLASGVGLASVSPWSGGSVAAVSAATGIGLIVVQWFAAGLGGYITGRLRANWVGVHTHEVFFRDTAHGFLTWALASLAGIVMTGAVATSLLQGGAHAAASGAAAVTPYAMDELFRGNTGTDQSGNWRGEAQRLLARAATGELSQDDRTYLSRLVAEHTGLSQQDAQTRVDGAISQGEAAVATARRAASAASIFLALSMLVGAFIASVAAAYGGGVRDRYVPG
jgi:hypothetical protein